jgi:hypothetical protein
MALTGTVSAVNFKKITTAGAGENWAVSPFDASGKALEFMTIEVDTTLGDAALALPEIVNFAGVYGTKITIIALTGNTNAVSIDCSGLDLIGSASSIILAKDGSNVVLTPVSATEWSAVVSA